jgi:hypothetical protein
MRGNSLSVMMRIDFGYSTATSTRSSSDNSGSIVETRGRQTKRTAPISSKFSTISSGDGLRPKRVVPPLFRWSNRNKARFVQNAQTPGNAGLVDPGLLNDAVDLARSTAQCVNDPSARRVGERLEGV